MIADLEPSKTEAYHRIEAILEHGPFVGDTRAVHRAYFLFTLRWSQAGARISEMNNLGWAITSITLPESEWENGIRTGYRLDSKPLNANTLVPNEDWYEEKFGKPRPSATADLPLFGSSGQ